MFPRLEHEHDDYQMSMGGIAGRDVRVTLEMAANKKVRQAALPAMFAYEG
jgi:hypothetical protein